MPPASPPTPDGCRPTGARHWVPVFAAVLAVIIYVDRVCMSQAKAFVAADLNLSNVQMGYVFSASTLAYGVFGVVGGSLGDLFGPRKVLSRIVVLWSLFTAATGRAWNLASLMTAQFFFGSAESGAFPLLAKAFTKWLPAAERNRAVGVMWLCSRWGGAITPLLVVWVINLVGWRWTFTAFAVPGILWSALFYWWFRDHPRDHKAVNAAELELMPEAPAKAASRPSVPWLKIARSRTMWLLNVQYFCFGYGWYFYITWLPTYVKEARGLDLHRSALLSGIPLFFGGFACIFSGWLASRLERRGFALVRIRRGIAYVGYGGAAGGGGGWGGGGRPPPPRSQAVSRGQVGRVGVDWVVGRVSGCVGKSRTGRTFSVCGVVWCVVMSAQTKKPNRFRSVVVVGMKKKNHQKIGKGADIKPPFIFFYSTSCLRLTKKRRAGKKGASTPHPPENFLGFLVCALITTHHTTPHTENVRPVRLLPTHADTRPTTQSTPTRPT
jgi:MFS family permease